MKLLAIDTSTNMLSLALADDQTIIQQGNWEFARKVSQMIMPTLKDFLKSAGCSSSDIDGYVVGLGPGSFTSLRVGLSVAKAMAFAHQKQILGVCSLDALALQVKDGNVCVINDAKRNLLYAAFYHYDNGKLISDGECQLLDIDSVIEKIHSQTTLVGSGVDLYAHKLKAYSNINIPETQNDLPDASLLLQAAFDKIKEGQWSDLNGLAPLYIYPEDCMVTTSKK